MTLWQFTVLLERAPVDQQIRDLLSEAHDLCVEVGAFRRWAGIRVDREGPTLAEAIVATVRDLDAAGLVAIDIGPDDDLVPIALIAERLHCHPKRVRRWSRGEGGFPSPLTASGDSPWFRWKEVSAWATDWLGVVLADPTVVFAAVNLSLRLRALAPDVEGMAAVASLLRPVSPGSVRPPG